MSSKVAVENARPREAQPADRCAAAALPGYAELPAIAKLPDPFLLANGKRVQTVQEWACRRAQLSAQVQHYELGTKPPAPQSVRTSVEASELLVSVDHDGKTMSFAVKIRLPQTGHAPYPALIGMGAVSLNNEELLRHGIALISFPNNDIGQQLNAGSRGKGKFYELYGSDHPASAMTAWAWGVSRLIDAIEHTPAARIDPSRLGVTGCSRNGKGAIVAGAFDERLRLTIAQESGSGGAAGWRVSDAQLAAGQNVQTLREIVQENVWFTDSFKQFGSAAARLPFDQHSVMGLIAPRALLVLENTSMEWLGNQSAYINAVAAREVWKALGVPDAMGISQVGGHNHCQLPASQFGDVNRFVQKFLIGDASVDTDIQKTDGKFSTDARAWIDWTTPALY